ncbi:gluconokinase [Bacillus spongiae]|uniref:Gluconokinase n=1 Tax=Bacillus spongiae TaxID=2683610 RepID=A0ABU8HEU0_9BACI
MKKTFVMGLDIGTTSSKALLYDFTGNVYGEYEVAYSLFHPKPGWAEQNPNEIERAAIKAIKKVVEHSQLSPEKLIGIGMSTAMHSLICVNEQHEAISPMLTWADMRCAPQAAKLQDQSNLYKKTGTPIHPMSPFVKLLWMKENEYEPYTHAAKFISIKEFILHKWFGKTAVDYSVASATGLFNIHSLQWEEDALHLAGIKKEQLSLPVAETTIFQGMYSVVAQELGLHIDTPFIIGGSDGPLANIGVGAIAENDIAITIGTSGAIRKLSKEPQITTTSQEVFCYRFSQNLSVIGGPSNNGGNVLKWILETIGHPNQFDLVNELALASPPGSDGLLFLPFLNGERAPYWDSNIRGGFQGLTTSHQKQHILRAGLEGVIFNLYSISQNLKSQSHSLYASGGFARSSVWLQILADIFGEDVFVPESHQSSSWGAAWTALIALGEVDSYYDIKQHIPIKKIYYPNEKNHTFYQELHKIYSELALTLQHHHHRLATLLKD